jgi:small subunit ribosomal protein S15
MALKGDKKEKIIKKYQQTGKDTGSAEVQVALLSYRIDNLAAHLKNNSKDNHSRRGLLGMISKRRRMLKFLKDKSEDRYMQVIKKVGLKK